MLAFYHPWYGTPWGPAGQWIQWDSWAFPDRYDPDRILPGGWRRDIASVHYPFIGPYDISDPEIVRWHIRLAKAAGIDGFITSWWKTPYPSYPWDWQAALFQSVFLPVAEQEGFKIAVLDECAHYVQDYNALVSRAKTYLPQFAQSPAYLKLNNEPAWFVYQVWNDWITPEQAAQYCQQVEAVVGPVHWVFDEIRAEGTSDPAFPGAKLVVKPQWMNVGAIDSFNTYSLFTNWRVTTYYDISRLYGPLVQQVHSGGKGVYLPIHPGHDSTPVSDPPYVADRRNGDLYRDFIRAASEAGPDVIAICSFNEWGEGTGIEPSWDYPDPYMYLKITAELTGATWRTPPLPPLDRLDPLIRDRHVVISNVRAERVRSTSAYVKWDTNKPSTSIVDYGFTDEYGASTPESMEPASSHSVHLTGLTPNSAYHFRARSYDDVRTMGESADFTFTTPSYDVPDDIIIDNADPECTTSGEWTTGTMSGGWGIDYYWAHVGVNGSTATFRPEIETPGPYHVYIYYLAGPNRSTQSRWEIVSEGVSVEVRVNQRENGSQWFKIADARQFVAGASGYVVTYADTGDTEPAVVIADAVRFVFAGDAEPPSEPSNLTVAALSPSQMSLSWMGSTDNEGVAGYKIYRDSVEVGTSSVTNWVDSDLSANTSYSYVIRAYDAANNHSLPSPAVAKYTLSTPPGPESVACDKPAGEWQSTAVFRFTPAGGFGPGTVERYRFAWDKNITHSWTNMESWWITPYLDRTATTSGSWYLHVKGYNGDRVENGTYTYGPFKYDPTPPVMGTLSDGGAYTDAAGQLSFSWSASDPESGIAGFEYAVGASPDNIGSIAPWTDAGAGTSATTGGLTLASGTTYYIGVKARNSAGAWSSVAVSDGITAADAVLSIAEAKGRADGTAVILADKVVSAAFNDDFYICETDRSSGIRVDAVPPAEGRSVSVAGILQSSSGERALAMPEVLTDAAGAPLNPILLTTRALGGGMLNQHTSGVSDGLGLNNIGLLVTIAGRVTHSETGFCYVDDGCAISDGSGHIGVRVDTTRLTSPPEGRLVRVTGISGAHLSGTDIVRILKPRNDADIITYAPPGE